MATLNPGLENSKEKMQNTSDKTPYSRLNYSVFPTLCLVGQYKPVKRSTDETWLYEEITQKIEGFSKNNKNYVNIYEIPHSRFLQPVSEMYENRSYKGLSPYKLELDNIVLFPELYFLFLLRIAKFSPELNAYCRTNPDDLIWCFDGNKEEVEKSVKILVNQFSNTIKANLGQSFAGNFGKVFSREYIEKVFVINALKGADQSHFNLRKAQLVQFAKRGKVQPLSDFLQAYCYPEKEIWTQVYAACLPDNCSPDVIEKIENNLEICQATNRPIYVQMERFQKLLKEDKIYPKIIKTSISKAQKRKWSENEPIESPPSNKKIRKIARAKKFSERRAMGKRTPRIYIGLKNFWEQMKFCDFW